MFVCISLSNRLPKIKKPRSPQKKNLASIFDLFVETYAVELPKYIYTPHIFTLSAEEDGL